MCYESGYIFDEGNPLSRLAPVANGDVTVTATGGPVVGKRIQWPAGEAIYGAVRLTCGESTAPSSTTPTEPKSLAS